ncbi:MAG: Fe-S protein assembly co-chaperone HscB [Alphaproteobacteria bacterium GM202ARS2]|nr:Fe-S protein assembly co-chaperone HscB [Alphaproteobacteria bacterium GM202ARS2]
MRAQQQEAWCACWSCQHPIQKDSMVLRCPVCNALQPYYDDDPFTVLAVAPSYTLDFKQVDESYIRLQAEMHPDRFPLASAKEKRIAAANTATLNACYGTLRHPLKRAVALMAHAGQRASTSNEQTTIDDPDLLMDMMTLREQLADSDVAEAKRCYLEHLAACEGAIDGAHRQQDWDAMDRHVTRLRYLLRLGEDVVGG